MTQTRLTALPLDALHFAALLERFAPLSPKIAVAVSGGPDSMALAYCLKRWAQRDLIALIVDHGLRPESAREATEVQSRLEQQGIHSEILRWSHSGVTGRMHEKARAARYHLLTEACRRHGAGDLFVAHHREDQAETILMRLAKGSGIEGLAGIAYMRMQDELRILRPFLPLAKQCLIDTCAAANITTVTDPSNSSAKFARGRLRHVLPLLAAEGLTTDTLLELGARAAEATEAIDTYAKTFLQEAAHTSLGGTVRIARAPMRNTPRATAMRAFSLSLRWVHSGDYPPERAALSDVLDASLTGEPTIRSLYGCLISISATHIHIIREPAAATEVVSLAQGQTQLWDQRWHVTRAQDDNVRPEQGPYTIRALGLPPHETLDRLAPDLRHRIPQGRIRATLPALWDKHTLCAIPSFDATASFHLSYRKQSFP